MKKDVTIKIDKIANKELYDSFIDCNYKAIEYIGAKALYNDDENIMRIDINMSKNKQLGEGDFTCIYENKHTNIEVKKCTLHKNIKKCCFDVKYLTPNLDDEYKQKNTYHALGWLFTCQADELMCYFNWYDDIGEHREYHIIKNLQDIKQMLIDNVIKDKLLELKGQELISKVNELNEKLSNKKHQWYNYHIQQDKNQDGEIVKQTLCIALHIEANIWNMIKDVYDIEIELE